MTITGRVYIDLRDVPQERMRYRAATIEHAPPGARVDLLVGALRPEPEAVDVLRRHAHRHNIEVLGEPYAVGRWVRALSDGMDVVA